MTTEALEIPQDMLRKWQEIMDLLAEIMRVPAALIVKFEPTEFVVLVSSDSEGNLTSAARGIPSTPASTASPR